RFTENQCPSSKIAEQTLAVPAVTGCQDASKVPCNLLLQCGSGPRAAEVAGETFAAFERLAHRLLDATGRFRLADVFQQQRPRAQQGDRIRESLAGQVGRAAVHRLKDSM